MNAVHETLEKVVDRLSTFETELTERRGAPNDLPPPPYNPTPANPPPPFVERRDDTRPPEPPFGATEDFLIEPGSGYRGRNGNSNGLPPALPDAPDTSTSRSDFIAAARRAAQAAQRETVSASMLSQVRPGAAPIGESKTGLLQGTRTIFAQYRRSGRSLAGGNLRRHRRLRGFEKPRPPAHENLGHRAAGGCCERQPTIGLACGAAGAGRSDEPRRPRPTTASCHPIPSSRRRPRRQRHRRLWPVPIRWQLDRLVTRQHFSPQGSAISPSPTCAAKRATGARWRNSRLR